MAAARTAALAWTTHVGVAAALLGGCAVLWRWADATWDPARSKNLLGVDWYFANVWSAVTAAEAVVLPTMALLVGLDVHRALTVSRT